MSTTKEQLIIEMENTGIFSNKEMTFVEYTDNLMRFQDMATKMIMGDDYEEGMRIEEAIFRLEAKARSKGMSGDPEIRKGINALKTVNKEIAISMAGRRGENLVARTLEFVNRPNTKIYRNVYVSNGEDETELDSVILTDSGIVILEIKNTKDDVTITEEGRLVHSGDECYEKKPIGEKMRSKRALLQEKLEAIIAERGLNIPVCIESFIVFSVPKGTRINVDDRLRREKWCFRTGLQQKIENYIGRAYYSANQIEQLDEILGHIESQVKRFELTLDFDEVRADFASALVAINTDVAAEEPVVEKEPITKKKVAQNPKATKTHNSSSDIYINILDAIKGLGIRRPTSMIAGAVTGALCVGAVACIGALGSRR